MEIKKISKPPTSSYPKAPSPPSLPTLQNLRQMRQERILSRVSTPKSEIKFEIDPSQSLIQMQEDSKHSQLETKRPSDLKLIFYKEIRPKSALKGYEENKELIKIAENAVNLFNCRKGVSGGTPCASRKRLSVCVEGSKNGSLTQRTGLNKVANNLPKPVIKSTGLLRKNLKK